MGIICRFKIIKDMIIGGKMKTTDSLKKYWFKLKTYWVGQIHLYLLNKKINHSLNALHKIDLILSQKSS